MGKDDRDGHLAGCRHAPRRGAALGVLEDVLIHLLQVLERLLLTPQRDQRVEEGVGGTRCPRVGHGNVPFERGVQQVVPRGRRVNAQLVEQILVGAKAQRTDIDAGPDVIGVLQSIRNLGRIGRGVRLNQPFGVGGTLALVGAAPPDVE